MGRAYRCCFVREPYQHEGSGYGGEQACSVGESEPSKCCVASALSLIHAVSLRQNRKRTVIVA